MLSVLEPRHTVHLIKLSNFLEVNPIAAEFDEQVHSVYDEVHKKLPKTGFFAKGNLVMVHLQKNRFPIGTLIHQAQKGKKIGPLRITKKTGDNL